MHPRKMPGPRLLHIIIYLLKKNAKRLESGDRSQLALVVPHIARSLCDPASHVVPRRPHCATLSPWSSLLSSSSSLTAARIPHLFSLSHLFHTPSTRPASLPILSLSLSTSSEPLPTAYSLSIFHGRAPRAPTPFHVVAGQPVPERNGDSRGAATDAGGVLRASDRRRRARCGAATGVGGCSELGDRHKLHVLWCCDRRTANYDQRTEELQPLTTKLRPMNGQRRRSDDATTVEGEGRNRRTDELQPMTAGDDDATTTAKLGRCRGFFFCWNHHHGEL